MPDVRAKMHQKSISTGAPPQTPLGELTQLPKKYMKFGKLILRKIIKIFATRCLILGPKRTKNRFRLGLCPRPRCGSLQRSTNPLAGFGGPTSKGMGGKGRWGEGWERREGEGKGRREERERGGRLLFQTFLGPAPHCTSFRIRASQPIAGQVQMFLKAY